MGEGVGLKVIKGGNELRVEKRGRVKGGRRGSD